jgi:hypothetical protein
MSKLYTEEQVTNLTQAAFIAGQNHNPFIFQIELNKLTPIELPSDEDVEVYVKSTGYYGHCTPEYHEGIEQGAKWMRDKIKGGNNE